MCYFILLFMIKKICFYILTESAMHLETQQGESICYSLWKIYINSKKLVFFYYILTKELIKPF